jgi:F-type H+-transporting ATPase subunit gamma
MANLKELRTRIASVKNTRKITSAMSQIAAARLRKAQNTALGARPYGERLAELVERLVGTVDLSDPGSVHPLMEQRDPRRIGIVLITADRGLCGGFNGNVNRAAQRFIEEQQHEGRELTVLVIGKKGRTFLEHRMIPVEKFAEVPDLDDVVQRSKSVAGELIAMFGRPKDGTDEPRLDAAYLIYNRFASVLTQEIRIDRVLPVNAGQREEQDRRPEPEPKCEPGRAELLAHLLPVRVESALQQAMFESIAAEIAARRTAMDAATDNATELIGELTLTFNRERQAAITKELMEIIGGAEALKG